MTHESPYYDYALGSILFVTAPVVPSIFCADMSAGVIESYMAIAIQVMSLALLVVRFRKHLKEDEKE
jgi:hypothetical protein